MIYKSLVWDIGVGTAGAQVTRAVPPQPDEENIIASARRSTARQGVPFPDT